MRSPDEDRVTNETPAEMARRGADHDPYSEPHEPEHEYGCANSGLDCERGCDCYGCQHFQNREEEEHEEEDHGADEWEGEGPPPGHRGVTVEHKVFVVAGHTDPTNLPVLGTIHPSLGECGFATMSLFVGNCVITVDGAEKADVMAAYDGSVWIWDRASQRYMRITPQELFCYAIRRGLFDPALPYEEVAPHE